MMIEKLCSNTWCQETFYIHPEDIALLKRFEINRTPDRCPLCRHRHRGNFRSSVIFYKRNSALSGRNIITLYGPHLPFPVYTIDEWWSDTWDALSYGRPFDPLQSFFNQFAALHTVVPKMANTNVRTENSEYSSYANNGKNCYYSSVASSCQDAYFSEMVTGGCEFVCDCLRCLQSTHLYECVQCRSCHYSSHLLFCNDCRNCNFCVDCVGCSDCLFCSNLRQAQYCAFNKQLSKQEFQALKLRHIDGRFSTQRQNLTHWDEVLKNARWHNLMFNNAENCIGDNMTNCQDCYECYHCVNTQGSRYCLDLGASTKNSNSMDPTSAGIGEFLYNSIATGGGNYFLRMCAVCRECAECTYCIDCFSCRNCFGCSGLRGKQYCILNRQYSKDQYLQLEREIIASMEKQEVWGEFFPVGVSPFAYNESYSGNWFPLEEKEIEERGLKWRAPADIDEEVMATQIPDAIEETDDDICKTVLQCQATKRKFKIVRQELDFYRKVKQPLPRIHPDVRMAQRRKLLNPPKLWQRTCAKCKETMPTTFSPERKENVLCEKCFEQEVYYSDRS